MNLEDLLNNTYGATVVNINGNYVARMEVSVAGNYVNCENYTENSTRESAPDDYEAESSSPSSDDALADEIAHCFFDDRDKALEFIGRIRDLEPKQITDLVKTWVKQRKLSGMSRGSDLWEPLHRHGFYPCSRRNWNAQVG